MTHYPVQLAVDLLDRLTTERTATSSELVRGLISLALHTGQRGGTPDEDVLGLFADLEALILGKTQLDADGLARMVEVAASLRAAVGIH